MKFITIDDKKYIITEEVAKYLKISSRRVTHLAKTYGVGFKSDRRWLFTRAEIDILKQRYNGRPTERKNIEYGRKAIQ